MAEDIDLEKEWEKDDDDDTGVAVVDETQEETEQEDNGGKPPVEATPAEPVKTDEKPSPDGGTVTPPAEPEKKTAEQLAEARAAAREEAERKAEIDRIVQKERQSQQAGNPAGKVETGALLDNVLKKYGDVEISDPENTDTGKSKLSDWIKRYPNIAEVTAIMAEAIAGVRVDGIEQKFGAMQADQQARAMLSSLTETHGIDNAADLAKDEAFWKFVDGLTPRIQALADSTDADDVAVVMRMYNEKQGHTKPAPVVDPAVEKAKAENEKELDRQKNLHGSTLRTRGGASEVEPDLAAKMEAEWDKDDDDDD